MTLLSFHSYDIIINLFSCTKHPCGRVCSWGQTPKALPWMIQDLDAEADRIGVTRQSVIKVWLAERLKELHA